MSNFDKQHQRQLDLVTPDQLAISVWVIGVGGIGSWTTLALSKMGCSNLVVFDFDKVEIHNTPAQLYSVDQVGQMKVEALKENILKLTGNSIIPIASKFEEWENVGTSPKIIINAVDSLETRRLIWNKLRTTTPLGSLGFDLLIDARMAGEFLRILSVSPSSAYSIQQYEKGLNSIIKPHEEPCTARSIIYNVFFCTGVVVNYVKKYIKGEPIETQTQLDLTIMQFI